MYYGLDFETYCDLSLPEVGLDRYVSHPSFKVQLACIQGSRNTTIDFVYLGEETGRSLLDKTLDESVWSGVMYAHNAGFERAVLRRIELERYAGHIFDSAVASRAYGGSSKLEFAARQFTDNKKLEEGTDLIKKFCMPNEENNFSAPTWEWITKNKERAEGWIKFTEYCIVDAQISVALGKELDKLPDSEWTNERITDHMNTNGWPVDLDLVRAMKEVYERNLDHALTSFYSDLGISPKDLNLSSPMQLQKWCKERGVVSKSFDSENVEKLFAKIDKKLSTMSPGDKRYDDYTEVLRMLQTKRELGGSALKKLDVILRTVGEDGRLRHQYIHIGAGQTFRTSGKGVQMQNLKRLGARKIEGIDAEYVLNNQPDNETLGENLRQVFTSSQPDGQLIVGDFSSVESRGLAWLAGADWKIEAFKQGKDMYKVAASGIFGVPYEEVTKDQRQVGKVAELSCGYGGGPNAVERFASIYGLDMDEEARVKLVRDWRASNPEVVNFWDTIDSALHEVLSTNYNKVSRPLANGLTLELLRTEPPQSLTDIHPGARSVNATIRLDKDWTLENPFVQRMFHGCYSNGRNISIFKPGETKNGPIWTDTFVDRNTNHRRNFDIYGGKVAGILTQSMCRELFFASLRELNRVLYGVTNVTMIGQFHDEIVLDWVPGDVRLEQAKELLKHSMEYTPPAFKGFPLEAEIASDYRYIK